VLTLQNPNIMNHPYWIVLFPEQKF
jgi:hypothetical protein